MEREKRAAASAFVFNAVAVVVVIVSYIMFTCTYFPFLFYTRPILF